MLTKPCRTCDNIIERRRDEMGRLCESQASFERRVICPLCIEEKGPEVRVCTHCGVELVRRRRPNGSFRESLWHYMKRRFCSHACADVGHFKPGTMLERKRRAMAEIAAIRADIVQGKMVVAAAGRWCFKCSGSEGLLLHHLDGDWSNNQPENLTPICVRCRL